MLTGSLCIGIVGYMSIEAYSLLDALYMSVITISTVGYGEVNTLSATGKLFTSFYIILNLTIFAYVVSIISNYLFEGELRHIFKNYFSDREVNKLTNHTIVCGLGRNGYRASEEFLKSGEPFVVVEKNKELLDDLPITEKLLLVLGDATHDDVLRKAGIERAKAIITTLPSDAENVFITLTARELNPTIRIVARASEENSLTKLERAGANNVVMPDAIGGMHMAQLITKPYVIEFLDLLSGIGNAAMHLEEFSYNQFKDEFKDKSLKELDIRNQTGVTIIGFKDDKSGFSFHPGADTIMGRDDIMIVLGTQPRIDQFKDYYGT